MDLNYYSSRKERLQSASSGTKRAYEKRNSKSFFKRNPQLKVLIIDLLIILLFATIIIPFFIKITKDVRVDNYKITAKAIEFDENILISVKISQNIKPAKETTVSSKLKVEIIHNNSIIKSDSINFPKEFGDNKYLTFKLENILEVEYVQLKLTSGTFSKEIKTHIER